MPYPALEVLMVDEAQVKKTLAAAVGNPSVGAVRDALDALARAIVEGYTLTPKDKEKRVTKSAETR